MTEASAPRLPQVRRADATDVQGRVFDEIMGSRTARGDDASELVGRAGALVGPFNAMVVAPTVGWPLQALGAAVRSVSSLPARARELAILTVADHARSAFEWEHHTRAGVAAGLSDSEIAAVADGDDADSWTALEAVAVHTTRRLVRTGDLTDAEYATAAARLGAAGVVELTTIVGYYGLLAMQMRVFRVDPPPPARPVAPVPAATLPRIAFDDLPDALREQLRPRVERLGYLGEFFSCCAHQSTALGHFIAFTETLKEALAPEVVEVVALTCAVTLGNDYERNQHERLCIALGLGSRFVADVEAGCGGPPRVEEPLATCQRYVLAALGADGAATRELAELCERIGPVAAVAVAMTAARYAAHALVVRSLGLEPPVGPIVAPSEEGLR